MYGNHRRRGIERSDNQGVLQGIYTLGHGFLESIYHNAMLLELVGEGLVVETEKPIAVYYEGKVVGTFSADIVAEGK